MYKCKIHYAHHVHVYECMYLVQNIIYHYQYIAFCGQVQNVHSILIQCTCIGKMSSAQSTFVKYIHYKICSNLIKKKINISIQKSIISLVPK